MADAVVSVQITGDASGLISAVGQAESALSGLGSSGKASGVASGKNNAVLQQTERSVKQAESSLQQLERGMKQQKETTQQYTRSLRAGAATFREKKTAVEAAAKAYKANTASLKENGENLQYQMKLLDGTVSTNEEHIAGLKSANKYLKRNSAEYKANQAAIKSMQAENKQLKTDRSSLAAAIVENDRALRTETQTYKKAQDEVKKAAVEYRDARSNLEQSKKAENEYSDAISKTNKQLSEQKNASEAARAAAKSSSETLQESGKRWIDAGEAVDQITKPLQIASAATAAAGVASAKAAIDFEDNFANVRKTVEGTPEQLEAVKQGIIDLTTTGINGRSAIPQSTAQLTELAAAGGQLGIATENIVEFTEVMAQMGTATNLSGAEGAATLARFMNVTNTSQDQVRNLGSSIVDLGNNFATTESEIAHLALRMGETGGVVGISAQDILGYSTALSSMGIEAEAGGSAVSRILMTMQKAVAAGGDGLEAFAKVSGKSAKEFKKQWTSDASGAFQDFIKGLSKAEDQISLLDELGFGNIRDIAALQALASTKGIDLMTDALNLSNKAWEENIALQREADAKADTTAGKMAIAKSNMVEAARSMGEVMLPTIVDVTGGITEYAQKLAGMNDEQKKAVVRGAAVVTGMGVMAKGAASTIKTVGNLKEGLGKLGVAVPSITKIGPAIASAITSPVGIATIAVAALGTAGIVAYKQWEKHKYHWADDMEESSEKLLKSAERYKTLSDYANELRGLRKTINDPDSSVEDIESAKARIKEIADLLGKEYNLKINVEDDGLDEAVDKVESVVEALTEEERKQTRSDYTSFFKDMLDASEKYKAAQKNITDLQKTYDAAQARSRTTGDLIQDLGLEKAKYEHSGDWEAYKKGIQKLAQKAIDSGFKDALTEVKDPGGRRRWDGDISKIGEGRNALEREGSVLNFEQALGEVANKAAYAFERADKELAAAKSNTEEYETAANKAGKALSKMLASDTILGDSDGVKDNINRFKELGEQLRSDGASTDSLAKSYAAAKQGFTEFDAAVANGSASDMARDFIDYKKSIDDFAGSESGVITTAAAIKNGFKDIETVSHAGGDAVNGIINDMKKLGSENGLFNGLDNNGIADKLTEMAQAMELIPETKEVHFNVDTGGFEIVDEAVQSLTQLEGKSINIPITVDGNTKQLELSAEQVKELQGMGVVALRVNADGDISLLNEADEVIGTIPKETVTKIKAETEVEGGSSGNLLDKIKEALVPTAHAAEVEVTADATVTAGTINSDGFMSAVKKAVSGSGTETETSVDVKVNYVPGEMPTEEIPPAEAKVNYEGNYEGVGEAPDKSGTAKYKGDFSGIGTAPTLHGTVIYDAKYTERATGTGYHPGGLAMVNDQKGIADPRELIIDKGRAFIPEGKDVILPLSRGAKVYTAKQTKAIMSSLGVPRYAKGTQNSDAFTNARDSYSHYINTHAVSTEEQLEKWNQLLKTVAKTTKDVQDAEEQIYSLRQRMYSEQLDDISSYLAHEKAYRNLDYDQVVAIIREEEAVVQKAYDDGLITKREYLKKERELDEQYLDEYKSMTGKLWTDSESYISTRTALNDFEDFGDDPISAYNRAKDRELSLVEQGLESWEEYYGKVNNLSEDMLDGRIAQSEEWLARERKYNSMSTADYIAGIDRMLDYTYEYYDQLEISDKKYNEVYSRLMDERADAQHMLYDDYQKSAENYYKIRETYDDWDKVGDSKTRYWTGYLANIEKMYREHNIGWQEYMDESLDKYLELYKAFEEEYDDKLQKYKDEMSDISAEYADTREALQKSWAQDDRDEDLEEVNRLLGIYANASTEAGQQKYKDLLDRKKQIMRDQELADLEKEEQKKLDKLQDAYDDMEKEKKRVLNDLRRENGNIFAGVKDMNIDTSEIKQLAEAASKTTLELAGSAAAVSSDGGLLDSLLTAVNKIATKVGTSKTSSNVYKNNGTYYINNGEASRDLVRQLTNTVVSGLGSVTIGRIG